MKAEIRKVIGTDKLVLGTERTLKALAKGELAQVVVASNTSAEVVSAIDDAKGKAEIVNIPESNEELGVMCKKPFRVAVLGIKK